MKRFAKRGIGFSLTALALCLFMVVRAYLQPGAPIVNGERKIVVIIPSYNNSKWCEQNVRSVLRQRYKNWEIIYIDDCSSDDTYARVYALKEQYDEYDRIRIMKNEVRRGKVYNLYHAIHTCDDHAIIAILDGDDWLKDEWVFQILNQAYSDSHVWMTYGQFEGYPDGSRGLCRPMPEYVIKSACYRKEQWITSHLFTCYAGVFKRIKKEDLMDKGEFFPVTGDQAVAFPVLEMAHGKIKFIDRVLYVYNSANPINDWRVRLQQQLYYERLIRRKQTYKPISDNEARSFIAA